MNMRRNIIMAQQFSKMGPMTRGTAGYGSELILGAPFFKHSSEGQQKPLLFPLQIYFLFEQQVVFRSEVNGFSPIRVLFEEICNPDLGKSAQILG